MVYRLLADGVLLLHFAFIVFVAAGALLVWRWRRIAWLHVPAVIWGVYVELAGRICPLTPLENHLRRLGGEAGYGDDFVAHYLLPLIYPTALGRDTQAWLGLVALGLNLAAYGGLWLAGRRARRDG